MTSKALAAAAFAILCLFTASLPYAVYAAPPQPVPELTGLLVDQAGALSEVERAALAERLQAIQSSGRAQVAILVSSGTSGEPLADYALRVAEKWQLGRVGRDDGLLILVIQSTKPSENAARIEVGYGLEGAIPDARVSRWLDDLLPAMKNKELATGLNHLLDELELVLPAAAAKAEPSKDNYLFPGHPEWRVPFVLVVFSPFALFPLFFGRWGSVASGPLLAAFLGGAAWALWGSQAGMIAAGIAFPLPLLWGLNWSDGQDLASWLQYGKAFGNLIAVAMFFAVIALFVGAGLWAADVEGAVWMAAAFAGLLATGLAIFLFPGKPARLLMVLLRSALHFVFILIVAWTALHPFIPDPGAIAFAVAGAVTACAALGLYLDSRGQARWARRCFGIAVLVALPCGLLALVLAAVGDDLQMQLAQAAAGGGSIAGALSLAARYGLFAAVKIGLGGRFGGGGAERS
ncbi:MAG TPA: TPM domain-containing protein [Burkholderiales bacterium]|nr:TPM domain-containing protein [Burkholderiales bacterium]